MSQIPKNFIQKYEDILNKNPKSQVFAPLAEAYRKMGEIEKAITICERGLKHNPDFASGHLALGRCYISEKKWPQAKEKIEQAASLAPENILAQQLLGDLCLKLQQSKQALAAFKMVLYLNPKHEKAQKAVKKLESLTADEYSDEIFAMKKLTPLNQSKISSVSDELDLEEDEVENLDSNNNELIDRYLSLVDAFVARGDHERAQEAMLEAEKQLGPLPELKKRKQYIMLNKTMERYSKDNFKESNPEPKDEVDVLEPLGPTPFEVERNQGQGSPKKKIQFLESLLKSLDQKHPQSY